MHWQDEGYLLSKSNFNENSIIIEAFTFEHGKYTGIVYGGSSRKQKKNFQAGNKILLNWKSKNENRTGYFNAELLQPVAPLFFEDKKRTACILSATSILRILLPERETNKKIYQSFEKMLSDLKLDNWINLYIDWELSLIKELGFEEDIKLNNKDNIKKALLFNRNLLMENFILPNKLSFPFFRKVLENYYN
tara:strand:+ start:5630 stop:6205 length:576 start_codon:yes stop_codon:yes gene_type:complete